MLRVDDGTMNEFNKLMWRKRGVGTGAAEKTGSAYDTGRHSVEKKKLNDLIMSANIDE